ncbi:unnamed protein product [Acanthoscelides obtectus]|uniref:Integrator complex subunit 9 n=2 Tax=Acanthoscelides obtectus TaxID=200917 RepID=A0A9P0KWD0_ACAOB|nr:unnamed protein product [Acanthoscelides obtectus]CAK1641679.1 Integrator complex subunit 9 [Acanthoscelides obtectus]
MKLYCLSNDPNKPCHILTFREVTMMLDCGLSMQSLLNFLPLSFVPSNKLMNMANWMPCDTSDPDLEGELKENGDRVFVDSPPEFCPPLDKLIDFSQVDVILISNYLCMMALPFITEGTGFKGRVYATEPTLQIGRLLLEELVIYIEQCPKCNFASQWKNFVHKCPYPLNEAFKPKSWKQIYNMNNVNASLSRIQMVGYNEKIDLYGALQVIPASSGYCLGSANWIISTEHEKIVYLSGSSTLTTHPRPMDHHALKNADILIMSDLTQTPISNPDSMLGVLCVVVGLTLRGGGNVLIPCYPTGVVYDLFECLSGKMQESGVANCPMFFISPVADMSLAYSNILAEWLSSVKQNKVYAPEEPFPHALLVKNNKLKHFKHIYSEGFSTDFQEVINLPLKRKQGQVLIETNVAQKIVPVEVKPGISLSTVTGSLNVKDNIHKIQELSDIKSKPVKYEWGTLNITEFLQKLSQEGITDAKVESLGGNVVVIHLQAEDALIQLEDNSTHVVCNADEKLRTKLRNIVMQCLKEF